MTLCKQERLLTLEVVHSWCFLHSVRVSMTRYAEEEIRVKYNSNKSIYRCIYSRSYRVSYDGRVWYIDVTTCVLIV